MSAKQSICPSDINSLIASHISRGIAMKLRSDVPDVYVLISRMMCHKHGNVMVMWSHMACHHMVM